MSDIDDLVLREYDELEEDYEDDNTLGFLEFWPEEED